MKVVRGDLIKLVLQEKFDVIVHGCNCFCTMGAGIAKVIKDTFPAAYKADLETIPGDKAKLGSLTFADCKKVIVVNGYTQYRYSYYNKNVDYKAIEGVFYKVKLIFSGKRIAYPKIGAGLAAGDWNIIAKIINKQLKGEDHTLVKLVKY